MLPPAHLTLPWLAMAVLIGLGLLARWPLYRKAMVGLALLWLLETLSVWWMTTFCWVISPDGPGQCWGLRGLALDAGLAALIALPPICAALWLGFTLALVLRWITLRGTGRERGADRRGDAPSP